MGSPTRKSEKTTRTRIEIVEQRWKPRSSAGQRYSPDQVVERPRREYSGQDTQGTIYMRTLLASNLSFLGNRTCPNLILIKSGLLPPHTLPLGPSLSDSTGLSTSWRSLQAQLRASLSPSGPQHGNKGISGKGEPG